MAGNSKIRFWWPSVSNDNDTSVVSEHEIIMETENVHEFNTNLGAEYLNMFNKDNVTGTAPFSSMDILRMAKNPMRYIEELRKWSRWAYCTNGTVTTAIDDLTSLHTLDYIVSAKPKREGINRTGYRSGMEKMNGILRNIRYKEVIRDGLFRDAQDGMYVAYFEVRKSPSIGKAFLSDVDVGNITEINASGVNATVIPLPIEYVRIVGRRNNCYEIAFDLRYFENMPESERKRKLASMPKQIKEGYAKYSQNTVDGNWVRLDWRKTICTKIKSRMEDPYGIPFAVAALDDIEYARYFINTKRRVLDTVNSQIYYETFPEGEKRGSSSLTQKQQKDQHDTVKNALTHRGSGNGVSFFSLAAGTKMDRLPVDISLLDEENENAISEDVNEDIGFSASALNGSSNGNYATASLNLELVSGNVYTWIEEIVDELNKVINFAAIQDKNYRIEFRVLPTTALNRDKMIKSLSDLYARGKGSLLAWIAATGINADDYLSLMDYELSEDFENKYPVHKTSFTVTGKDAADGDVSGDSGNVSTNKSTESTVANNGNASPSPSD